MYLRTLLYALRQGVALESGEPSTKSSASSASAGDIDASSVGESALVDPASPAGRVPDRLLDMYLSSEDSISLTSKVLDVYAGYVDEGEVSR